MTRPPVLWRGSLLVLLAATACTPRPPPTAQERATQATVVACRQRADEIYQRQNRAALYTQDNRDSPGSSSYDSGITTRGLADRYGWDSQVSDCIRNQGSADEAGPGLAPTTAASTAPLAAPSGAPPGTRPPR